MDGVQRANMERIQHSPRGCSVVHVKPAVNCAARAAHVRNSLIVGGLRAAAIIMAPSVPLPNDLRG